MDRVLCLDIGDRRTGIAVSDPFNEYALPVETYYRKNLATDIDYAIKIALEKDCSIIVCGLPVNADGTESIQTQKTKRFITELSAKCESHKIKVVTVDERFTSVEAHKTLSEQNGLKAKQHKQYVDSLAATYILESYLREQKKEKIKMDENKKNCNCGCDDENCTCDDEIVMLTTDEGKQIKFFHIGTLEYKEKFYAAFQPAEEVEGVDDDEVVIFEVKMDEDPNSTESELVAIEDEKLLDEVFDEFCKRFDEEDQDDDCDCDCGCHDHHHES